MRDSRCPNAGLARVQGAQRPGTCAATGPWRLLLRWSDVAARTDSRVAALECAALVLTHPAPDARVLAALQRPAQAVGSDGAAMANGLRLGNLQNGRTAGSHGEEQLGVLVTAGRVVAPVHFYLLLAWARSCAPLVVNQSVGVLVNAFTNQPYVKTSSSP